MPDERPKNAILSKSGEPFKSEQAALSAMANTKLDPKRHEVIKLDDDSGYAILPVTPLDDEPVDAPTEPAQERFFRVRFHAKSNPEDQDDVHLSVNGEMLVIQREKEVILPERFLECADHAVYPKFRQLPDKPRKVTAHIKLFGYDRLGEATREEWLEMKSRGTKQTQDMIRRYGFDYEPDVEE